MQKHSRQSGAPDVNQLSFFTSDETAENGDISEKPNAPQEADGVSPNGSSPASSADLTSADIISSEESDTEIIESELLPEQSIEAAELPSPDDGNREISESNDVKPQEHEPRRRGDRRRESVLIAFFTLIANTVSRTVKNSFFSSLLTSYDNVAELFRASFLYSLFSGKPSEFFKSFKKRVRRLATDSVLAKGFSSLVSALLLIKTRIYGLILFAFGISSLFVHFFIAPYFSVYAFSIYTPFIAIGVILVSLFLIISGKTLLQAILGSRLLSAFSFKLLGLTRPSQWENECIELSGSGSVVLGLLLGFLTVAFPIQSILLFLLSAIYALIVIKSPEAGLISLFLLAPFASLSTLAGAISVISVSYIFKVACGKRTLMLEFPDLFVGIFAVMLIFGGIVSFGKHESTLIYALFTVIYFIAASILRSERWFRRSVSAIVITGCAISVYAIIARALGETLGFKLDVTLETDVGDASASVLSSFSVLSYFVLILGIFMLAYLLICKQRLTRFILTVTCLAAAAFMFLTLPKGAWLAAIVACVLLLLLWKSRTAIYMLMICLILPFLPALNISSVEGALGSAVSSYERLDLWNAVIRMLGDVGIGGIGIGKDAFTSVYSAYFIGNTGNASHAGSLLLQITVSLGIFGLLTFLAIIFFILQGSLSYGRSCSDKFGFNRIICYAGMCGIIASFIWGISEFIWYDPRTMLLFWLIAGVTVSARRSALCLEADSKETNLYGDTYLE